MPKPVTLPEAAMEHMSDQAKAQLANHAPHLVTSPVEPLPVTNTFYGTSENQSFEATDGEIDVFYFDINQSGGSDEITNYNPDEDRVYIQNSGNIFSSMYDYQASTLEYVSNNGNTTTITFTDIQMTSLDSIWHI